jgi:hypothetical protein
MEFVARYASERECVIVAPLSSFAKRRFYVRKAGKEASIDCCRSAGLRSPLKRTEKMRTKPSVWRVKGSEKQTMALIV